MERRNLLDTHIYKKRKAEKMFEETKSMWNHFYGKEGILNIFGKIMLLPSCIMILSFIIIFDFCVIFVNQVFKLLDILFLKK